MPLLTFHSESGDASVFLGDELGINLANGQLGVGGAVLATHREGSWYIHHVAVERTTCDGPVCLSVHTPSGEQSFGPLTQLVIGANSIWSEQGTVARYNDFTKSWALQPKARELGSVSETLAA